MVHFFLFCIQLIHFGIHHNDAFSAVSVALSSPALLLLWTSYFYVSCSSFFFDLDLKIEVRCRHQMTKLHRTPRGKSLGRIRRNLSNVQPDFLHQAFQRFLKVHFRCEGMGSGHLDSLKALQCYYCNIKPTSTK